MELYLFLPSICGSKKETDSSSELSPFTNQHRFHTINADRTRSLDTRSIHRDALSLSLCASLTASPQRRRRRRYHPDHPNHGLSRRNATEYSSDSIARCSCCQTTANRYGEGTVLPIGLNIGALNVRLLVVFLVHDPHTKMSAFSVVTVAVICTKFGFFFCFNSTITKH